MGQPEADKIEICGSDGNSQPHAADDIYFGYLLFCLILPWIATPVALDEQEVPDERDKNDDEETGTECGAAEDLTGEQLISMLIKIGGERPRLRNEQTCSIQSAPKLADYCIRRSFIPEIGNIEPVVEPTCHALENKWYDGVLIGFHHDRAN